MNNLSETQVRTMNEILEGSCRNPHDFLGMHQESDGVSVRVYDPAAETVTIIVGRNRYLMHKTNERGIFTRLFARKDLFAYKIE